MSGTELIMGMEELVQHIRELEKQNKQLQQGKKELLVMLNETIQENNEAIDELTQENEDNLASLNFYTQQNDFLKDERKQLKEEINHKNKAFAEWCEENKKLKEEIKEFQEELDNEESAEGLDLVQIKKLKEEIRELKKEQLTEENAIQYVYENTDLYDDWVKGSTAYKELQEENKRLKKELDEENGRSIELIDEKKKLREENRELEMKGNARKDIIKNMFECITADTEEVQDGFYIKRDWGNKYIDKWNEIVSQEYQDALKDINEQLEGIEWVSDGYQFDLNIVDESEEDSDEEPDSP
jgi:DNA repair exonuclease SbcCD ATPase subunit